MRHSAFLLAAALSPLLAGSPGAQETGQPTCGAFKVFGTVETRGFVDLGDVGATAGDQRVGRYALADANGNDLGVMHFSSVIMPPWDEAESPAMTTLHYNFENGSLVAMAVVALPSPSDPDVGPDHQLEYAVTGGTGDFAHASGTLTTKTIEDGRREMSFDLRCGT